DVCSSDLERGRGVRRRVVVVKAHSVGDGGEVDQLTGCTVLGRVGAAHGDHVGRVTGGGGGGELVEVAVEDGRLGDDRDPGVLLHEQLDHLVGLGVAVGVAPPGEPDGHRVLRGRDASCGEHRDGRGQHHDPADAPRAYSP